MKDWKAIDLNGTWRIDYMPQEMGGVKDYPCTIAELEGWGGGSLEGKVPGNFELALEEAGILPEIYKGTNILLLQKYESYHVFYSRYFDYEPKEGFDPCLVFEGIDTLGEIWVNGRLCGRTDNMFLIHSLKVENLKEGRNEIMVHLLPVCVEARKEELSAGNTAVNKYNYESLRLRKAAHMFGWDIMPRCVSCGIFRPVSLVFRPKEYIRQAYLMTAGADPWKEEADLLFFYDLEINRADLEGYKVELTGKCEDSAFHYETRLWYVAGKFGFHLEHAKLWQPKGYGTPYLYEVKVTLKRGEEVLDSKTFKTGIRTVELVRTGLTDLAYTGEFYFKVNGKRVFILGTNFVPVDAFHSRDRERLPQVCALLEDVGCNAIRIWGGNLYEDDYLYDYCDEHGILIWQDFMMACGIYPNDDAFGKVIAKEVKETVRRLRQHPCILVWAGDNENDMFATFDAFKRDPNRNRITRKFIPEALELEDSTRPYLPSSPYVDEECVGKPLEYLTEAHLWGPRDYFRSTYYTKSLSCFASEMGYHGCCSVESMKKFIPKEQFWPWEDNPNYAVHAACPETGMIDTWGWRIHLMANQIREMFGSIPEQPEPFAMESQISQAEAMKFFVELFRVQKSRRSGIIWWNLIDGWPQFSDAVVDYYFQKKLAYYYIKNVQKSVLVTFSEPDDWKIRLVAVNDTGSVTGLTYSVRDYETGEEVLEGSARVGEDVLELGILPYSHGEKHIYLIEWESEAGAGSNHYLCGEPPFDPELYRKFVEERYQLQCWR